MEQAKHMQVPSINLILYPMQHCFRERYIGQEIGYISEALDIIYGATLGVLRK